MMDKKHCSGCADNFYNGNNPMGVTECWMLAKAKLVMRIPVGHWEDPPYVNKKEVKVPDCWNDESPDRIHYVKPEALTPDGYWK